MRMIGVSNDVAEPRSERVVGYHEGKCWGVAGMYDKRTRIKITPACLRNDGLSDDGERQGPPRAKPSGGLRGTSAGRMGFLRHGEAKTMTGAKVSPVVRVDRAGGHCFRLHLAIPRWVAPQHCPTPFHQTKGG